jgi:hypothetical protein
MVSQEFQCEFIRENVGENLYTFLDKLNRFLKIKLFPAVLGLLKYCFVHEKKYYKFRLINE